jgi:hypothetical protein
MDTFGHSATFAKLASDLGSEGMFMSRIDPIDKHWIINKGDIEFNWEYENDKKLFMSVFPGHYNWYDELEFGTNDDALDKTYINDKESEYYNAKKFLDGALVRARNISKVYRSNHVFFSMGEDLEWSNAEKVFYSIDRFITDFNALNNGVTF